MKIEILKSGSGKAKTYAACPLMVDLPPDGDGTRKATPKP